MPRPRPTVLIVDADHRVRRDLALLLELESALALVGAAGTLAEADALIAATDPDAIVIDPRLPDVDAGLAFVRRLAAAAPRSRVVVMSCAGTLEDPALACGAFAFVAKSGRPAEIVEALTAAAEASGPAEMRAQ